ncbi:hypothetical protein [Xanthomonas phage JGB6]|nr:hypothetical protein [Xanthomonas phage JGB6]
MAFNAHDRYHIIGVQIIQNNEVYEAKVMHYNSNRELLTYHYMDTPAKTMSGMEDPYDYVAERLTWNVLDAMEAILSDSGFNKPKLGPMPDNYGQW